MKKCSEHEESELLKQLSKGEEHAFQMLFEQYSKRVFSFAFDLGKTREVAEEITQEVFLKIWLNKEKMAGIVHFEAYLYSITRNRTIDHLRKMANETAYRTFLWQRISELSNRTEEDIVHQDYLRQLNDAIRQLPPQQQLVFSLSRKEGMSNKEIALQLNISPNTVKNHMVQALKSIRAYLNLHSDMVISIALALHFLAPR